MNNILILSLLLAVSGTLIHAQKTEKIFGTIGNEKMGKDKIVICVYGTAACMPVNIDTTMTIKYQGKETKFTQLPFGLYLEAETTGEKSGIKSIKNIVIDENKTVMCLAKMKEGQNKKLNKLITNIQGVKRYKLNTNSNQVYIEFDSNIIAYKDLENKIKQAGYELE